MAGKETSNWPFHFSAGEKSQAHSSWFGWTCLNPFIVGEIAVLTGDSDGCWWNIQLLSSQLVSWLEIHHIKPSMCRHAPFTNQYGMFDRSHHESDDHSQVHKRSEYEKLEDRMLPAPYDQIKLHKGERTNRESICTGFLTTVRLLPILECLQGWLEYSRSGVLYEKECRSLSWLQCSCRRKHLNKDINPRCALTSPFPSHRNNLPPHCLLTNYNLVQHQLADSLPNSPPQKTRKTFYLYTCEKVPASADGGCIQLIIISRITR